MTNLSCSLSPPPPRGFNAVGTVLEVRRHNAPPPFIAEERKKRKRGRKAQGIKYEAKCHEEFRRRYGSLYIPGPWFHYAEPRGWRWCQPDGLIYDAASNHLTIIECKYQHTFDAWWQLFKLYLPVMQAYYGPSTVITCCEVVKWFDPAVYCNPPAVLSKEPTAVLPNTFGVHIYSP